MKEKPLTQQEQDQRLHDDSAGLTLDGTVNQIAMDGFGNCIASDSVQRLHDPHVLYVVPDCVNFFNLKPPAKEPR